MGWERTKFYDAARNPDLSDAAARLALHLGGYANGAGRCWPSQSRLAVDLGWSLSKTKRAMGELVKAGLVSYLKRATHRGETSLIQLTGTNAATGGDAATGGAGDTSQNNEVTGATESTGVTDDPEPVSQMTLGSHPKNSTPVGGEPFVRRLANELRKDHGFNPDRKDSAHEAFHGLLTFALEHLPEERHHNTSMGVIADFVEHVQGYALTSEARAHTARMVRNHSPSAVLYGYGQALDWGAGTTADYADDPLALSRYVAGVLSGKNKRGAA